MVQEYELVEEIDKDPGELLDSLVFSVLGSFVICNGLRPHGHHMPSIIPVTVSALENRCSGSAITWFRRLQYFTMAQSNVCIVSYAWSSAGCS